MAQLIKQYPQNPERNRIVFSGKIEDMVFHLNAIEKRIGNNRLSQCGTSFTEMSRVGEFALNTCIYKNIDTEDEESMDINYMIFP